MTPLVLVHGFMGGSAQWAPQRCALSDTRNLITIDLPGFGQNADLPSIDSISGFADWVLDQLSYLEIERFHLLGHSMGGMIVQEMVHRAPHRVDHVILYATGAVGNLPGRFETIEESKRRAQTEGFEETARRIAATWFLKEHCAAAYPDCAEIAAQSAPDAILKGLDAMRHWRADDRLSAIKAKTMVIWGDQDRTYSWAQTEQLWRSIPQAELAVVPGCAHAVHLEKPNIFNALLSDFLSRTEKASVLETLMDHHRDIS
ncbi:2-hydroxy-6-oxononadienedioate/2-hydroxy-6-oxononatrienedioate hydrolase [Roseovarius albus]|uniref:2-hydroxy-6-oxononadienedioate/2-hydroxy-6-oxononatrienedioate hydrolase n=1 Tax=Roseovarius albus TaxID=1247867 RepID=A0A1X7A4C3_9RHOB|nr:alpha/beta fold hydrolase [Roseovarius albus]SLN69872.1 2-hydroxy-6-oxononadienedioate/2-hydroxy-6-oxononatrienedioate hydrolase [Roseovarius albus]